jgi:hypothetical protein
MWQAGKPAIQRDPTPPPAPPPPTPPPAAAPPSPEADEDDGYYGGDGDEEYTPAHPRGGDYHRAHRGGDGPTAYSRSLANSANRKPVAMPSVKHPLPPSVAAAAAAAGFRPPVAPPAPPAAPGTGKRAAKAAKRAAEEQAVAAVVAASPAHAALKARLEASLPKESLLALVSLCSDKQDDLELPPLIKLFQALDAEGFCDTTITAPAGVHGRGGLTVAGKSGAAELQRIGERAMSKNKSDLLVMRNSVSFLRRVLRDEGFPIQLFAE